MNIVGITTTGIEIRGTNRWQNIYYAQPRWADEPIPYFVYKGHRYYLANFAYQDGQFNPARFDGYVAISFFSGLGIIMSDDMEQVKVWLLLS